MRKVGFICLVLVLTLGVMGGGIAYFSDMATINVTLTAGHWELGGSSGFWKHWDKIYTETEILGFLTTIDEASYWLVTDSDNNGTIEISDMEAVFDAGQGPDKEKQFLRQYLATMLNVEADRLYLDTIHLFNSYDPGNYLGLGGQGTLQEIIAAIEGGFGTSPTEDEFVIMKKICEALNKLQI